MKSLGSYYTEENVRLRLEKNRYKTKSPKNYPEKLVFISISPLMSQLAIERDLSGGQN